MKKCLPLLLIAHLLMALLPACGKTDPDCGSYTSSGMNKSSADYFAYPADIYWGLQGNTRYYTYNWTLGNICPKYNPKVYLAMGLQNSNTSMSNPFTVTGGISTCLAVQPQTVILTPNSNSDSYSSPSAEIGMQQCFSGQPSATIYPYITISFTSLGSSSADSTYLTHNVLSLFTHIDYNLPK